MAVSSDRSEKPFLYVVVCAAGVAGGVGTLITAAHARGWAVGVIATPQGLGFIDADAVVERTGYPVRSAWRRPGEPRPLPPPDAIAVAPATFNTVNKWAAGISDTLALGTLCEAYGTGVPTAVLPYLNADLAAHPAYRRSLGQLRAMGVLISALAPHPAGESGAEDAFRWEEALDLLEPRVFGSRNPSEH
ncbi:flavoprotein [Streptomyces sp. NBC_01317]|uniref:flavoprotein n=1 Tax=Streptomyces sp. NBC_01317 TaxID=2903822 RepID=UPI002E121945|nr:flavoprotein [Streptomyces sp. NBC_01317]